MSFSKSARLTDRVPERDRQRQRNHATITTRAESGSPNPPVIVNTSPDNTLSLSAFLWGLCSCSKMLIEEPLSLEAVPRALHCVVIALDSFPTNLLATANMTGSGVWLGESRCYYYSPPPAPPHRSRLLGLRLLLVSSLCRHSPARHSSSTSTICLN
jgi:hypothetical protein